MPNNKENITIVVELLKQNGIRHMVISPGGTNIALVRAVQDDSFFTCYSVVDERSAAYFAIGLYLQLGEPIVLCCTSAQATRNYIPGLTEAYYKHVPLLAVTMQKHPRFTGQEYMQAPNQSSLPVDCVKQSFVMPYISDVNDIYHSIRVANEAMLELVRDGFGPVQLCVPWLDFPMSADIPKVRKISRYPIKGEWDFSFIGKRILVAIGEHRPITGELKELIGDFCRKSGAAVYANLLSNYHSEYSVANNLILTSLDDSTFSRVMPDILITIGGQTGDYPFYRKLSKPVFSSVEHWRVSESGKVVDTYDKLTRIYHCSEEEFFRAACFSLNDVQASDSYRESWAKLGLAFSTNIELPFSNAWIAKELSNRVPAGTNVQLSILNSLRVWELFEFTETTSFYSNVGAFGIDGGMSTLIGQSFATDDLCLMVIGDLAFLYDINSLSIRGLKPNVRILLINNNGGFEFKINTGHDSDTDRYIAAAGHFRTAKGWATDCGFEYMSASTKDEFMSLCDRFLSKSDKPLLLEAFIKDDDEYEAFACLMNRNQMRSFSDSLKESIKHSLIRTIGSNTVKRFAHS